MAGTGDGRCGRGSPFRTSAGGERDIAFSRGLTCKAARERGGGGCRALDDRGGRLSQPFSG